MQQATPAAKASHPKARGTGAVLRAPHRPVSGLGLAAGQHPAPALLPGVPMLLTDVVRHFYLGRLAAAFGRYPQFCGDLVLTGRHLANGGHPLTEATDDGAGARRGATPGPGVRGLQRRRATRVADRTGATT